MENITTIKHETITGNDISLNTATVTGENASKIATALVREPVGFDVVFIENSF